MASPKARGRMICKSISESEKIAALSPMAAVLFMMLIPHFNAHGKMPGGAGVIKDDVVPLLPYFSYENLPQYLQEISDKTNVKWFRDGNRWWLHSLHFNSEHQELRADKMGSDDLPGYQLPESGVSTGVVPDFPSRAEGLKVGSKEERTKDSSTTVLEESNGVGQAVESKPSSSIVKMGLPEFREAFYLATGNLLPGGLNAAAVELCQHHPRDKLQEFFGIMAEQGGRTFKYFREVVSGKPKAGVEKKTRGQQRQAAAIANAQETLRRLEEMEHGQKQATGDGVAGFDGGAGCGAADYGAAVAVF